MLEIIWKAFYVYIVMLNLNINKLSSIIRYLAHMVETLRVIGVKILDICSQIYFQTWVKKMDQWYWWHGRHHDIFGSHGWSLEIHRSWNRRYLYTNVFSNLSEEDGSMVLVARQDPMILCKKRCQSCGLLTTIFKILD